MSRLILIYDNTLEPDLIIHHVRYVLKMEFLSVSINLTRTLIERHHLHVNVHVHVHFM